MQPQKIIELILGWAVPQPQIEAVILVGSYARGAAKADSDIDLLSLTHAAQEFRHSTAWVHQINWSALSTYPSNWQDESHGAVWSRRMWLDPCKSEIELSFALPSWASINPVDPGTYKVITDGCQILHDPNNLVNRLCQTIGNHSGPS